MFAGRKVFLDHPSIHPLTASFQVAGESYESDETDERLDSGVGNRGLDGIGGGLGGGDSCGSDLHDDDDDDDEPGCWCRS